MGYTQGAMSRAVFLDRDGTINEDPGYLNSPDLLKLLPHVGEALALLKKAGFKLIVVSNQSGVGRGLIDPKVIPQIHSKLSVLLGPSQVQIDHYELCFHRPEEDCQCRKPKPKLILDAATELGVDLLSSYMVGDKLSDLQAGRAAGCKGVALVRTGEGKKTEKSLAPGATDFIGDGLLEVAKWIQDQET